MPTFIYKKNVIELLVSEWRSPTSKFYIEFGEILFSNLLKNPKNVFFSSFKKHRKETWKSTKTKIYIFDTKSYLILNYISIFFYYFKASFVHRQN